MKGLLMGLKNDIMSIIKEFIFPPLAGCLVCGREGSDGLICRHCLEEWSALAEGLSLCSRCGRFRQQGQVDSEGICADCLAEDPPFVLARGALVYEGPVREAIHRFKFSGMQELAVPFGDLMAALVADLYSVRSLAAVVPVPLHPERLRERRFDQSALLASAISRSLHLPLVTDLLCRCRATPSQTNLSRLRRRLNLVAAFTPGDSISDWQGQTVLLVDDVYTTGATAGECSRTLLAAGIGAVYVVTLATGLVRESPAKAPGTAEGGISDAVVIAAPGTVPARDALL
jgi:ComF family protein